MKHEILVDEITRGCNQIDTYCKKKYIKNFENVYVLDDGNPFGDYIFSVFSASQKVNGQCFYVSPDATERGWIFADPEEEQVITDDFINSPSLNDALVLFTINCLETAEKSEAEQQAVLGRLNKWLLMVSDSPSAKLLVLPIIPSPQELPEGITSLAEREYDYALAHREPTAAEAFYLKLESLCRECVGRHGAHVNLLRFANLYGPAVDLFENFSFKSFFGEIRQTGSITITQRDAEEVFSCAYIVDAFKAILSALYSQKKGHIFNVASKTVTLRKIKTAFYDAFPGNYSLSLQLEPTATMTYRCLNSLKLAKFAYKTHTGLEEDVYRIGTYYADTVYDMMRCIPVYSGRLEHIKNLEMEILKFVDSVCREHNIQYFLAGGSLLGAIRHQSIIPWDDDLDIGMLREDFEKFRKVCPTVMTERFTYESPQNDSGSHYQFDKIRLKNTYFSTNYSSGFRIRDGVFFDVIIYDQTSNNETVSKWQIRAVDLWTRALNIRWHNKPRKGMAYKLSKRLLPVMRLFPLSFYHVVFERLVRWFEKKRNAKFLIDGIGQNIRKGRFPKEWLSETEYVPFGDMMAPIPKGYDGYLRHFYGDHYMELLPISKRTSGHHIARIDLGGYLFDKTPDPAFRDVHIDGELFETEK